MFARAYVQAGAVIALHVSSAPISLVAVEGCAMFDLTLSAEITAADLSYSAGTVTGPGVLSCTPV